MKVPLLVLAGPEEGKLQLGLTAVRVRGWCGGIYPQIFCAQDFLLHKKDGFTGQLP